MAGQFGVIDLSRLLVYAKSLNNPKIPEFRSERNSGFDKKIAKEYRKLADESGREVPKVPGWYAWINAKELNGHAPLDLPNHIFYIGKTEKEKRTTSSLHTRINDYLDMNQEIIWASVYGTDVVLDEHLKQFPPDPGKTQKELGYRNEVLRHVRRAPATHIIWYGQEGLDQEIITRTEKHLIQYYHPCGNWTYKAKGRPKAALLPPLDDPCYNIFQAVKTVFDDKVAELTVT